MFRIYTAGANTHRTNQSQDQDQDQDDDDVNPLASSGDGEMVNKTRILNNDDKDDNGDDNYDDDDDGDDPLASSREREVFNCQLHC